MDRKTFTMVLFVLLMVPFALQAHEPSKHKGKPIKGEVVSLAGDRFEVKTANGTKTVAIVDGTKFERGDEPAAKADLRKGEHVTVVGTTLASGEFAAREVLIEEAESHGADKHGHKH